MSHSRKYIQLLTKLSLFGIGLTLVACGGGGDPAPAGGGGGGGPTSTSVTYTGISSPAEVNDTNTQSYSAAIMDGSQDSQENLGNFGITAISTDGSATQNKQHAMLSSLVKKIKKDVENNNLSSSNLVAGVLQPPVTGNCPGKEGSYTIDSDQTATGATASITYNSYCTVFGGITTTISGSLTAGVVITGSGPTLSISSMSIAIPRLSIEVISGTETYKNDFSGSISVSFTADGEIANMTVSMNFIENGKVYKLSGLSYTTLGADISISGTIFHPDYGSVTFTTTEPFALFNDQLCGGTLSVIGVNSNFMITADATCSSYTYTGTNNLAPFSGNFAIL